MAPKAEESLLVLEDRAAIPGRRASVIARMLEGNPALGAKLFARNYVQHKPWRHPHKTEKDVDVRQLFPDLKVSVEDAIETGDRVVVRWRAQGTHKGKFEDVEPTGAEIDFTGINIYRFAGDRIVESWGEFDAIGMTRNCEQLLPRVRDYVIQRERLARPL